MGAPVDNYGLSPTVIELFGEFIFISVCPSSRRRLTRYDDTYQCGSCCLVDRQRYYYLVVVFDVFVQNVFM